MPDKCIIDLEPAFLALQAKRKKRMIWDELAAESGISIAALYRLKSSALQIDLRAIYRLCKVLECNPGDIIFMPEPKT